MDNLPEGSTAAPDDDAARYEAALELNARLRAQAAQLPSTDAGYGPSDGEGADDEAKYQAAMELNARLRATAAQLPGYGPADGLQQAPAADGPPTVEDLDEIDQLQQALAGQGFRLLLAALEARVQRERLLQLVDLVQVFDRRGPVRGGRLL